MLLVHPPVAKPCEPPAGLARLAGALGAAAIPHTLLDANLEGLHFLLQAPSTASDTWTRRARRHRRKHLAGLTDNTGYRVLARYHQAVNDLNRLLAKAGPDDHARVSLTNYQDRNLAPVRSVDLLTAAETYTRNPFWPYFKKRLPALLDTADHDVVGFSLNYLSQALCAFAMLGFVRHLRPHVRLVLGGGLVTSWLRRPHWRNPFGGLVDDLVAGAGENFLLALAAKVDSDSTSAPDYGGLQSNLYLAPGFILPYSTSSGCFWQRCSFCPERAEKNPFRPLAVERVVAELSALIAAHRPCLVHLLDNALHPALLRVLARQRWQTPWYGFARFSHLLTDLDFCRNLKRSGCVMLKLGLESGSQQVLDRLNKGIDLNIAARVLETLKQAGIATYVYLLFGTPAEEEADARETLEFTARHHSLIGFLNLAIFNLPCHGPDVAELRTSGFYTGDLSLYCNFHHPRGWDRPRVRQFLEHGFKRHPAVAPILRRQPPVFTSNHAPFFSPPGRKVAKSES